MRSITLLAGVLVSVCFGWAESTEVNIEHDHSNSPAFIVRKVVDRHTGSARIESNNPDIRSYRALDSALLHRRKIERSKYGAANRSLHREMSAGHPNDSIDIAFSIKYPPYRYLSRFRHSVEELRAFSRSLTGAQPVESPHRVAQQYGIRLKSADPRSHFVYCRVTLQQVHALAFDKSVQCIEKFSCERPLGTTRNFNLLVHSALNPEQHPLDKKGAAVKNAIVEWQGTPHAQQTQTLAALAAPDARQFFQSSTFYTNMATDLWLVNNEINVSSLSLSRALSDRYPSYSEFMMMDDLAYRWPCPLFCTPSGNGGVDDPVHWQAYSALCVGSVKHWGLHTYVTDDFTSARNPDPIYGVAISSTIGTPSDRELPELLVPGSHPDVMPGVIDTQYLWGLNPYPVSCGEPDSSTVCDYTWEKTWHGEGTSYSAAAANGLAARVISSNLALLANKPDAVKMVLILTAHNVEGGHWNPQEDGRDGTGVLSVYDAIDYALTCHDLTGTSANSAVERGFYTAEADSSLTERVYNVLIPENPPENRHLRVTLVWTSNPDFTQYGNYLSDLDIGTFSADSGVYGSYSMDASVEVFDVPRHVLTPGATYTFRLFPRHIRIPPDARTNFFYFTLGWTWVRTRADSAVYNRVPQPANIHRVSGTTVFSVSLQAGGIRVTTGTALEHAVLLISDLRGRIKFRENIKNLRASGRNERVLMINDLAPGTYTAVLLTGGKRTAIKFVWPHRSY